MRAINAGTIALVALLFNFLLVKAAKPIEQEQVLKPRMFGDDKHMYVNPNEDEEDGDDDDDDINYFSPGYYPSR